MENTDAAAVETVAADIETVAAVVEKTDAAAVAETVAVSNPKELFVPSNLGLGVQDRKKFIAQYRSNILKDLQKKAVLLGIRPKQRICRSGDSLETQICTWVRYFKKTRPEYDLVLCGDDR